MISGDFLTLCIYKVHISLDLNLLPRTNIFNIPKSVIQP